THDGQGSDMGLFGGLLGWEAFDERLQDAAQYLEQAGIAIEIVITDIQADHPNTYKLILSNDETTHIVTAISTGGGMIEVIALDGNTLSMKGDYFELLLKARAIDEVRAFFEKYIPHEELIFLNASEGLLQIKLQEALDTDRVELLKANQHISNICFIDPVLPVLSRKNMKVPFSSVAEMLAYNEDKNLSLWQLAVHYESARGNISEEKVLSHSKHIIDIIKNAVAAGLKGTQYTDRLLGAQSVQFKSQFEKGQLIDSELVNTIIMYVSAIMEVKSSMGVIVAAPTAGSCGAMPGAILAVASSLSLSDEETVKALLISGLIGVFIAAHSTFAAEVGGCQAECGSGSSMAAAGIVYLAGGNLNQSIGAASMALQSSLGMICDPIGNRVEAPCLNRNVMAASNALSCANMALADYDHLIPLDEVIETMYVVGKSIPNTLRCTNLGGLSITKTAKEIEQRLRQRQFYKSC